MVYGGFTILAGGFAYLIYTLLVAGIVNPTRTLRNVFIQNAPSDPANLLVRPEVRALSPSYFKTENPAEYSWRCLETYEPGNALMERTNCMWAIRLLSVARM